MKRTIITINREFCSGGRLVGKRVSDALSIPYYDRELITLAAEKSGLAPEYIEKAESLPTSSFLYGLATTPGAGNYFTQYEMPVVDRAFLAQSAVIREFAEQGSCVIIGRCASFILRDDPDNIRIFIYGSVSDRLKRGIETYGLEKAGLADKLIKIDKGRANYFKFYTGEPWRDTRNYDLAINTAAFGVDGTADAVLALVKSRGNNAAI
jgi:cytidylate kinase